MCYHAGKGTNTLSHTVGSYSTWSPTNDDWHEADHVTLSSLTTWWPCPVLSSGGPVLSYHLVTLSCLTNWWPCPVLPPVDPVLSYFKRTSPVLVRQYHLTTASVLSNSQVLHNFYPPLSYFLATVLLYTILWSFPCLSTGETFLVPRTCDHVLSCPIPLRFCPNELSSYTNMWSCPCGLSWTSILIYSYVLSSTCDHSCPTI